MTSLRIGAPHGTALRDWLTEKAGVTLGKDYPGPIVDHATARDRALAAYDVIKGA